MSVFPLLTVRHITVIETTDSIHNAIYMYHSLSPAALNHVVNPRHLSSRWLYLPRLVQVCVDNLIVFIGVAEATRIYNVRVVRAPPGRSGILHIFFELEKCLFTGFDIVPQRCFFVVNEVI